MQASVDSDLVGRTLAKINNNEITRIELSGSPLSLRDIKVIFKTLRKNLLVTYINLQNTNIGDEGAQVIAQTLKINTTLERLDLTNNEIGPKGASAISNALEINIALTHLSLAQNKLGAEGLKLMALAFDDNCALEYINLRNNGAQEAIAAFPPKFNNRWFTPTILVHESHGTQSPSRLESMANKNRAFVKEAVRTYLMCFNALMVRANTDQPKSLPLLPKCLGQLIVAHALLPKKPQDSVSGEFIARFKKVFSRKTAHAASIFDKKNARAGETASQLLFIAGATLLVASIPALFAGFSLALAGAATGAVFLLLPVLLIITGFVLFMSKIYRSAQSLEQLEAEHYDRPYKPA